MPQLIPLAVAGAKAIGTWWAAMSVAAKVWFVVKVATLVASTAYTMQQARRARAAMRNGGLDQGRTVMTRDPIASRRLIYGQVLVSGNVVFIHTTGAKNEFLHLVVILAGHEVEEIGDVYFNDEVVPLSAGLATGKYAGYARVTKRLGTAAAAADADLIAETGGVWTSAHKNEGCAALVVRLKWSPDLFPNGLPAIKALVKGKKVYDPRTATTVWSANSALCAADYLMNATFGKGVAYARIREADLIEAANICDENVVLDDLSTEDRYTTNGTINADQDPSEVLRDLAGAMAGTIIDTGGTWTIRAGAYRSPTVTLTDDDLMGSFSMQPRQSRQDTFNRVRGIYISPDMQWAPADFPAISNSTYKTADGGIWLDRDIELGFTTSPATAQRLAKISLERGRQQITCSAMYSLKAMQLMPGDVVNVTRSKLGWSAKPFEVVEWTFTQSGDAENPTLGVQLSLRETAAGVWDWADGEETAVDLAPNTTLPNPFSVPTPSGLTLTSASTMQEDGTVEPRFTVEWTTPDNIHVEQGGFVAIEYKVQADSEWLEWSQIRGDLLAELITGVVVGETYDVRIRFINNAGVRGAYSTTASVTVLGDVTAPATPTGLTAITGTGKMVSLDWNDNTEPDLGEYAIYRHTADVVGSAVLIAEVSASRFVDVDVSLGTTYYYWISAIDRSENESAKTASVNAEPAAAGAGVDTTPAGDPASAAVLASSGTYLAGDGTVRARLTFYTPYFGTNTAYMNLLYRRTGSNGWRIADQLTNPLGSTSSIDDLTPGVSYDVACQSYSPYGYASGVVDAGSSPYTAPNDASGPATPTGLAAVTGTGKSVSLDWADNTEADFSEYAVYRHTSNSSGSATKLAETRASRFVDVDVTFGQDYYYWVKAIDRSENNSAFSSGVGPVTPGRVAATDADATAPSTPSAASKTSQGTYTAGDGTVYAYLDISVPALPTLAKYQNLLYKKASGGGDWLVAAQLTNTGAQTVRIDDLSPGTIYDVAVQAFSAFAIASAITVATASPFTAPNKTTGSTVTGVTYTSGNSASYGRPPMTFAGSVAFTVRVNWNRPSDLDLAGYEVAVTGSDSDASADAAVKVIVTTEEYIAVNSSPSAAYVRVRAFNSTGVRAAWAGGGTSLSGLWGVPAGTMMNQNASSVAVTGGSATGLTNLTATNLTGTDTIVSGIRTGGSGARKIVAEYVETVVPTLAGGSPTEDEAISISGRGFSAKPDTGYVEVCSDTGIGCFYYFDAGSNSSSTAYIRFYRYDGGNLASGAVRCSVCLVEYD